MADKPPPKASSGPTTYDGMAHMAHQQIPPHPMAPHPFQPNSPSAMIMDASGNLIPQGPGGTLRRAAPEPNKRALYVGGLNARVTEDLLKQIFESNGDQVMNVKIIPDKNVKGMNYGFVEYNDPASADKALQTLNGRKINGVEIKVNWAYQSSINGKEDTSSHFHVFVGDLSNEVNDDMLFGAFAPHGGVSEARVMWDMKTGRTRGYGFVAFRARDDAQSAIDRMDGEWLGSRTVRCNWANQKGQPFHPSHQPLPGMPGGNMHMQPHQPYAHPPFPSAGMQQFQEVLNQSPSYQTTIYVGNLTPYSTADDLVPLFLNFGPVLETRIQADRGFAFLRLETHEYAASAICQLNGYMVNGRPIKCSWGKDRPPAMTFGPPNATGGHPYSPQSASPYGASPQNFPSNPSHHQVGDSIGQYGSPPPTGGQYPYSPPQSGAVAQGGYQPSPYQQDATVYARGQPGQASQGQGSQQQQQQQQQQPPQKEQWSGQSYQGPGYGY